MLVWLLAAWILTAQALFGVHALDHLNSTDNDFCEVCLSGGHLGTALPSAALVWYAPFRALLLVPLPFLPSRTQRPSHPPRQRGPPAKTPAIP